MGAPYIYDISRLRVKGLMHGPAIVFVKEEMSNILERSIQSY